MNLETIKQTAVELINENGLENLSRNRLCVRAGIPPGSFTHVTGMTFKAFIRTLAAEGYQSAEQVTRSKLDRSLRKRHILLAALRVAERDHYSRVGREAVAEAAGVSASTVSAYFPTLPQLRRAVLRMAREQNNQTVIDQAG